MRAVFHYLRLRCPSVFPALHALDIYRHKASVHCALPPSLHSPLHLPLDATDQDLLYHEDHFFAGSRLRTFDPEIVDVGGIAEVLDEAVSKVAAGQPASSAIDWEYSGPLICVLERALQSPFHSPSLSSLRLRINIDAGENNSAEDIDWRGVSSLLPRAHASRHAPPQHPCATLAPPNHRVLRLAVLDHPPAPSLRDRCECISRTPGSRDDIVRSRWRPGQRSSRAVEMGTCSALGMEIEVAYDETKKTGIRDGWEGGKGREGGGDWQTSRIGIYADACARARFGVIALCSSIPAHYHLPHRSAARRCHVTPVAVSKSPVPLKRDKAIGEAYLLEPKLITALYLPVRASRVHVSVIAHRRVQPSRQHPHSYSIPAPRIAGAVHPTLFRFNRPTPRRLSGGYFTASIRCLLPIICDEEFPSSLLDHHFPAASRVLSFRRPVPSSRWTT
ncbi:hypothetical protein B0H14DRAFT_3483081 [Mycena olivaceomarginata]|nr:hypothetical protein B0H14DRAFT_3483081 [Mycena olivaceomarginata]